LNAYNAANSWHKHFVEGERSYPSQGLIRLFRGTYPDHEPIDTAGKKVLDLGSGDGRNSEYLRSLGAEVYGVEISEQVAEFSSRLYPKVNFQVGESLSIPFPDSFFDLCVAWNSVYYMKESGDQILSHFKELARVTIPQGRVILSIPMPSNFIYGTEKLLDSGLSYVEISRDPFGVRNGQIMAKFGSLATLKEILLSAGFKTVSVGEEMGYWFGLQYDWWVLDCQL
jgi:SAM-dependent methyltransferase